MYWLLPFFIIPHELYVILVEFPKNLTDVLIVIIVTSGKVSYIVSFAPIFFYVPVLFRIEWTTLYEKLNLLVSVD